MLRSTELNTFSMINTIYRDLLCRANGGGVVYRLRGGTPWQYDELSTMHEQTDCYPFILVVETNLKMVNFKTVFDLQQHSRFSRKTVFKTVYSKQ